MQFNPWLRRTLGWLKSSKPTIITGGLASNNLRRVTRYWSYYLMMHLNSRHCGRAHMKCSIRSDLWTTKFGSRAGRKPLVYHINMLKRWVDQDMQFIAPSSELPEFGL